MKTVNQQAKASRITRTKNEFVNFGGGLDLTTPAISTNPGTVRDSQNWYVDTSQGYERIAGYERVDGQARPSDATYATLDVTITGSFSVGDTITGVTSGATGVVLAIVTLTTPDYLVITKITGTFDSGGEDLNVAAAKEGESLGSPVVGGASTLLLNAQYLNLAADEYRGDIAAVPGSGDVLGTFVHSDIKYAWRNNAGGTAAALYKSSASGWTLVALGEELAFTSGGTTEIVEGNTITGATSAATAVVARVVTTSGTWAGGDAAGKFVFASHTGTFQAENIDVGASGNLATVASDATALTMNPGGRFEVIVQNFGGAAGTKRAYGVDGVNRGWEFDGTVFVPIDTGMTTDTPAHCFEHKYHLFFSFGSSAQHSGPGTPYVWSPILGASELAVGDDITGFSQEGGGQTGGAALAIVSRNKTHMLYGSTVADWSLVPYRDELGGYEWSIQQIGSTMMVDDRGVSSLVTSDKYGNFEHSTLSRLIRPWVAERRTGIVASCISRENSQYRLFFGGGEALYTTLDGTKVLGMMPMVLGHNVKCVWSSELDDGSEIILFGDDNGVVYQMDKGTSFDGDDIEHFFVLHFTHLNSPYVDKEFFGGFLEIAGGGYASFNFTYELAYGKTTVPQPTTITSEVELSSSRWDEFTWDAFYWDGRTLTPSDLELSGQGENISLIVRGLSDYHASIKLSGALLQYRPRVEFRYTNG